jgi:hypothetical protein
MIDCRSIFSFRKAIYLNLVMALCLFAAAATVTAEPYIAVRTGFKCSQCHMNRIGGGERTEFGSVFTQTSLTMPLLQGYIQSLGGQSSFNPKLNESVTLGGNFRLEQRVFQKYTYTDHVSSLTDSTGKIVKPMLYPGPKNPIQNTEANLYINVELLKNFFSFYTDQTISNSATKMREMYGMVRNLPLNGYMKFGYTLLPYGLRLMDDEAFIRNRTGYTYQSSDFAGEIGIEPGPFSLTANLTNAKLSTVGSVVFRNFRLGGSYGNNMVDANDYKFGPFLGANFGRFTLMSEMDIIKLPAYVKGGVKRAGNLQRAEFLELDFLAMQGVNIKAVYEYFDINAHIDNKIDGQERLTFGLEPFITQFMQFGFYYRLNRLYPQNVTENQDVIIGRVHVFF